MKAVPVEESEIYPFEREDVEAIVVANFQSDEDPPDYTDTLDNVKTDGSLTPEQLEELRALLTGHRRCFLEKKVETHLAQHYVHTGDAKPIYSLPYRVSVAERKLISEHVEKMIAEKIIRPSFSSWSSPVLLVRKKSGEVRFCIDYRRLNAVTERDGYFLPRIEDVLGRLSGAKYFSSLDLESGKWPWPKSTVKKRLLSRQTACSNSCVFRLSSVVLPQVFNDL